MSIAYGYDPLFNKSRLFIARALEHRTAGRYDDFQLWASLSLELLAKAALAYVQPTLVADPNDFSSMLAAAGHPHGVASRSIMAKTAFDRLLVVAPGFDRNAFAFCMLLAARRNDELHSGALPYLGTSPDAWVPTFWTVAGLILGAQGKILADWVGADEAGRADELVNAARSAVEQAVAYRIEERRAWFNTTYPLRSPTRRVIQAEIQAIWYVSAMFGQRAPDAFRQVTCPACGSIGAIGGDEYYTEVEETPGDLEEPPGRIVTTYYKALALRCRGCNLNLDGQSELDLAGLPTEFSIQGDWEPDVELDYGNE